MIGTTMRTLNDGHEMPQLGLGVWQTTDGAEIDAVKWALEAGYRHIDTAAIYRNEEGVGEALVASSVSRTDIWLTTKLWNKGVREGAARSELQASLKRLKLDFSFYSGHRLTRRSSQSMSAVGSARPEPA